jgi:hypothetical protein
VACSFSSTVWRICSSFFSLSACKCLQTGFNRGPHLAQAAVIGFRQHAKLLRHALPHSAQSRFLRFVETRQAQGLSLAQGGGLLGLLLRGVTQGVRQPLLKSPPVATRKLSSCSFWVRVASPCCASTVLLKQTNVTRQLLTWCRQHCAPPRRGTRAPTDRYVAASS